MLTTLLFALTLATAPDLAASRVAAAEAHVGEARKLDRECFSPRECAVAAELVRAADAELAAARALAAPSPPRRRLPSDPWQADYQEPFVDLGPAEAMEARAAWELSAVQDVIDTLGK